MLDYARDLGVALQLTNILRDVAVDYRRGRLYLPLDDLARFGCTEADIAREVERRRSRRAVADRCTSVLEHQAARARVFFARAVRALPAGDAHRFVAAEIMRAIYFGPAAPHRGGRLRRVHARDPRAAARAGATGRCERGGGAPMTAHLTVTSPAVRPADAVVVIGAGFAGLSAAVRLAQRRTSSRRRRGSAAAGRPRDRVHRSRDRRARRQRPARAVRLLSRDVRVSRARSAPASWRRCSGG